MRFRLRLAPRSRIEIGAALMAVALAPVLAAAACSSTDVESTSSASGSGAGGGDTMNPDAGQGGSGGSGGSDAGGGGGGGGGSGGAEPSGPVRYPSGALHSPMAKSVVDRLKTVLAGSSGRPNVFAKVGDSNTVNTNFASCFAGADVKLGAHADLEPTRALFAETLVDDTHTSFDRVTLAAKVGWSAAATVAGSPSPIEQEVAAIAPGFAVVMLGTNDTYPQGVEPFEKNLLAAVDASLGLGVVPLLTTIPPRSDTAEAEALVYEMNAIVRAVAQARQVPMMDLFATLKDLPGYGLIGDGVHLSVYASGGAHACWFDENALQKGMNQRNLITLAALDRVRRFVQGDEAPEAAPPGLVGEGTWQSPVEVDALPFVDDRDTSKSAVSEVSTYACAAADEGGPEVVYRIDLPEAMTLRARVFDGASSDVDLHFMADPGGPSHCIERADKVLEVTAGPGTFWLSVDTFVASGMPQSGAYRLTIVRVP